MRSIEISASVRIGFGLTTLAGIAVAVFLAWQVWQDATKGVTDSWVETGTIVDFEAHEETSGLKGSVTTRFFYFADVRTGDGDIVRVSAGKRQPIVGKRVKLQWVEYEDGSVDARLARPKKNADPYRLNNI